MQHRTRLGVQGETQSPLAHTIAQRLYKWALRALRVVSRTISLRILSF